MKVLKRPLLPLLALGAWFCALLAAPLPAHAAVQSMGGFALEQVYVNVPEMDVFVRAQDADGNAISPQMVRAAGVELHLGDTLLETGNIQMANEARCFILAVDNNARVSDNVFRNFKATLRQIVRRKQARDQVMLYTLAGGAQCVLPPTTDAETITAAINGIERTDHNEAADMSAAAVAIYQETEKDFQRMAPRKVLLGFTQPSSLLNNLTLLGGLATGAADQLNMDLAIILAADNAEEVAFFSALADRHLLPCTANQVNRTVQAHIEALDQVLELKTAIPEDFYGERLETLTLSVPAMGSAVTASTSLYMGHRLTPPAIEAVRALDRQRLRVTFNQPVSEATAALPAAYLIESEDVWGFRVPVRSAALSADGTAAILTTTAPLYSGPYSVRLRSVAAALSSANTSDASVELAFTIEGWPRDRAFYLARLRMPVLVLAALLLVLAVRAFGRSRKERAAEHEAQIAHLLSEAENAPGVPQRWLTLFIQPPGAIAENRWSQLVASSLVVGSDAKVCELCVPDSRVAAQHCLLSLEDGGIAVQALGKARVYVNGECLGGPYRLQNDDVIKIGRTTLRAVV